MEHDPQSIGATNVNGRAADDDSEFGAENATNKRTRGDVEANGDVNDVEMSLDGATAADRATAMFNKWAGAQSGVLFENPVEAAGVGKIVEREHLVFFQESVWSNRDQLYKALCDKGVRVLRLVVFPRNEDGRQDLRPMARALVESPLSNEMLEALKDGLLRDCKTEWKVRRGCTTRTPKPLVFFLRLTRSP